MDQAENVYDPGPVALPSDRAWLDPVLIGRNLIARTTDVAVSAVVPTRVAELNAARWAVGFTVAPGAGSGAWLSPWSDTTTGGVFELLQTSLHWFRVPKYGPLVMGEWWAIGGAGAVCRVVEILRR